MQQGRESNDASFWLKGHSDVLWRYSGISERDLKRNGSQHNNMCCKRKRQIGRGYGQIGFIVGKHPGARILTKSTSAILFEYNITFELLKSLPRITCVNTVCQEAVARPC